MINRRFPLRRSAFEGITPLLLTLLCTAFLVSCRSGEPLAEQLPQEQVRGLPPEEPVGDLAEERDHPHDGQRETLGRDHRDVRTRYAGTNTPTAAEIDSMIEAMSLREKIGQLFVIPVNGRFVSRQEPQFREWESLVRDYKVGGLIFMAGDVYGQAVVTRQLQEMAQIPLWISQDMEFGAAMRVEGSTRFTPAMGIAATGDPENAFIKGQITAREARALGVHQIFAPVLDVNNNPDNPVINVRSYSSDPDVVARFGEAFIQGVESEGVLATAKHFPGHGDTRVDSHLALPVISHSWQRLDSLELEPFRKAISNGLRSIMSAHISYPNVSSNPELPATLDPDILRGVLADSLGFDGLVVTDGLEMQGITSRFSPGDAVVRSLQSGADIMLISPDPQTAIYEVEMAVRRGQLTEDRINQSVRKILTLKVMHGVFDAPGVDPDILNSRIHTRIYQAAADRIARESITVPKNDRQILPITGNRYQRIAVIGVSDDLTGSTGTLLASEMRRYHPGVTFHSLDARTGSEEKQQMLRSAREADLLVIGSFINVRSGQQVQLNPDQREFIAELGRLEKPSVVVAFGNPYVLRELHDTDVHVLAWSASDHQVRNTVPALFGAAAIAGQLPIGIPGLYEPGEGLEIPHSALRFADRPESVGMSTDSLLVLEQVMQRAIEDSVFPGGVIAVVKDGVLAWNQGYGYHDYGKTRPVRSTDLFDLASVTKVMATTTAIMKLYDEGRLELETPVARYIPEYDRPGKDHVTIRQLLLHTSRLPAYRTYVDVLQSREEIIEAVRNEPLLTTPPGEYIYSDLGFILLGEIVEIVSGLPLDRYLQTHFYTPMGMAAASFNPLTLGEAMLSRILPTEIDNTYRGGLVHGRVHDERAYFLDGVAGHAGLFATSRDLAVWSQMLLNGGYFAGYRYLSPETVSLFTGHQSPVNERGLGFDRKSGELSSAGKLTSEDTYGHLGFTGTSVWIDPEHRVSIILLTNRTYPHRSYGTDIRTIRPTVADTVMRSIID